MNAERGTPNVESDALASLVCFALREEAAPFQKVSADKPGVLVLITGMGRKNAEKSVRDFLASHVPTLVLTCGFAGGLSPELAVGVVVFATDDVPLRKKLAAAGARPARFHCVSRIATTVAEKQELRRGTGADAVEMESEAILDICREQGIPCGTVRVISDTANEDLPLDFNRLAKPDLSLDYGKLAVAVAKSPGKVGSLLRLRKQTRFAAEKLAEVLAKVS
jgi:adenosylhomocysteine nucleosidase